jgi:hypothetical protein
MIDQKREVSTEELSQWILERSEPRTEKFDQLIYELDGDAEMAETMWLYWGADALQVLDHEIKALNPHLRWWKFGQKRNTIRTLLREPDGKQWVWRMLHDAGAWL